MHENALKNKIILIGFMGTGKSSVADGISQKLHIPKADVDAEIVTRAERAIPVIFEQEGEEAFRALESKVLYELLQAPESAVIATGGGAVLKEMNREHMLEHGLVIQLFASPEVIISRVKHDTGRPLLQGDVTDRVNSLLKARAGAYDFAHLTIDTTNLTLDEVVDQIVAAWNQANLK